MTLAEWCKIAGVSPTHPTTERGAVSLIPGSDVPHFHYTELWRLDDYSLTTISGPVVWLVPRRKLADDVVLSSGRTMTHRRMDNGATEAIPTTGHPSMTHDEWTEYSQVIARRARKLPDTRE